MASYYLKKNDKLKWASLFENQIGYFYSYVASLAEGKNKVKFYLEAIPNYSKALDVYSIKSHPSNFINTNNNIGNTYLDLFTNLKNHSDEKYLMKQLRHFKVGLEIPINNDTTFMLKNNLIRAHKWYVNNGEDINKKKHHLDKAIQVSKEILTNYTPQQNLLAWVYGVSDLADLINLRDGSHIAIKLFKDKQLDLSASDKAMKAELFLMEYLFLDKLGKKDLANEAHTRYKELLCSDQTKSCSDIFPAN